MEASLQEVRRFEGRIWQLIGDWPEDGEPVVAMVALDRQALLELKATIDKHHGGWGAFCITMPCGKSQEFRTAEDIPFDDLPCPCGNPEHWLIKYGKGDNDGKGKEDQEEVSETAIQAAALGSINGGP